MAKQNIVKSILREIDLCKTKNERLLIAIDGRCAAGKTTLALELQKICGGNVFHMDDFFLRQEQRTEKRLREPGGNIDYERFLEEIILPLKEGISFSYRPYDCGKREFKKAIKSVPAFINIIEGSYSCHPHLKDNYNLKIFLSIDKAEQLKRILHRNGENQLLQFREKWIPMEETYFSYFHVENYCNLFYRHLEHGGI